MRVRIIFKLQNKGVTLPFHHQHILTALINDLLDGYAKENLIYNFSGLKGQTRISRQGLHYYSSRVTLVFSCLDKQIIDYFLANIFRNKVLQVGNSLLVPEKVEEEQQPIFSNLSRYVCISPLVIVSPDNYAAKEFVMPNEMHFSDMLYESTMSKMESSGLFSAQEIASFYQFQIIPDKTYIEKLKSESKKFARIYTLYHKMLPYGEIRGYTFPFSLYAHPKVHHFIFNSGFGEVTNAGYGMLDIAHADPLRRCVAYQDFVPNAISKQAN
ncbi:MAG: CRISPR-associated endoribonuclease Cas6 [Cytophagales bacterium]|nr:MAG: CRISPR-associated endoribonuclease Cas6 [Cytophagales bacterium]